MLRRNSDATAVMPTETSGAVLVVPGVALPELGVASIVPTPPPAEVPPSTRAQASSPAPRASVNLALLPAPVGPLLAVDGEATAVVGMHRAPSSRRNLVALLGLAATAAAGGAYYVFVVLPGVSG